MRLNRRVTMALTVFSSTLLLVGCFSSSSSSSSNSYKATITYTEHNVPHIQADNYKGLGFGMGYVQAKENMCTLSEQIMKLRGEKALYFGGTTENIGSDVGYKALDLPTQATKLYGKLSNDVQDIMEGYAKGFNQSLDERGGAVNYPTPCAGAEWVTPITAQDLLAYHLDLAGLASARNFLGAMAAAQPPVNQQASAKLKTLNNNLDAKAAADIQLAKAIMTSLSEVQLDPKMVLTSEGIGSNGWALGKNKVKDANSLLIGNPHFPWDGELRFYEQHLTIPGELNVTGVGMIGLPSVVIGFNENLGWTHTVSQSKRFTLYQLTLDPTDETHTTYIYDGEPRKMTSKEVTVQVKTPEGSIFEHKQKVYFSHFGPIVNLASMSPALGWSEQSAISYRDATAGNVRMLDQWIAMNKAKSTKEFFAAFETHQALPWVNTLMIDKEGNASYIDGTQVPQLNSAAENYWRVASQTKMLEPIWQDGAGNVLLPGNNSIYEWKDTGDAGAPGLVPFKKAPQRTTQDYVFNANSSYWLSNVENPLKGYSYMYGPDDTVLSPRTRYNAQLVSGTSENNLADADGKFTMESLQEVLSHNGSLFAGSFRTELVQRCDGASAAGFSEDLTALCAALDAWDGTYNVNSAGAHIMREFLAEFKVSGHRGLSDALFANSFVRVRPATTPSGLAPQHSNANADPILKALAAVKNRLAAAGIALDAKLGDIQYVTKAKGHEAIPISGANSYEGVFNMAEGSTSSRSTSVLATVEVGSGCEGLQPSPLTCVEGDAAYRVNYGSSYVMALKYGENGPQAKMFLSYGQSHDPQSDYFEDQTQKYSDLEWRDVVFTKEAIAAKRIGEVIQLESK